MAVQPQRRRTVRWSRRLLASCPVLIAILWIAGIARFRQFDLAPLQWAALVATGFALHVLTQRLWRPRPLPTLPANTNAALLAALAAAIVALLAAIVGGIVEWLVESLQPAEASWALRTTWHATCAFGACYCAFLLRVQLALEVNRPR